MKIIITGGCGFIGSNAASRYLRRGDDVVLIDNLSRVGASENLKWLEEKWSPIFLNIDIRESHQITTAFSDHSDAGLILHLAGQVAVTTSVTDPRADFEANALGTFNVLEATRLAGIKAPFIYSSTNKVYGGMEDIEVTERDGRYAYANLSTGIPEERNLDFHSPYGCSKGSADQYVRDYHRIYGLQTVVFRQSCIYGYRQFGIEDQGWVAWFTIATITGRPITIYGDGKQVRDILFIEDLLDAFDAGASHIGISAGQVYNVGGGPENVISLHDLISELEEKKGESIHYDIETWRPGDQRVYVSDIGRAVRELGWRPQVSWKQGIGMLYDWVKSNRDLFTVSKSPSDDHVDHTFSEPRA